jgi:hypothetical protein
MNGSVVVLPSSSLRINVQAIREQAKLAVRVKSVALLFTPLDTSGSKAGTQSAYRCGGSQIQLEF